MIKFQESFKYRILDANKKVEIDYLKNIIFCIYCQVINAKNTIVERAIKLNNIKNFGQLFINAIKNYREREVLKWKVPGISAIESENYQSLSAERLKEIVYFTSRAIEGLKLSINDKAAIISENRYEWVVSDFGCIFNKIVTVPIYTTMTTAQIKYILEHSETKLCFVSNKLILEKVISVSKELPNLKRIICFNKIENFPDFVFNFEDFIKINEPEKDMVKKADDYFKNKSEQMNENDILTIIYTSGTTGIPKGVCLTHKNILANIKSCSQAFQIDHNDTFLSFLPLAHSYERT
ncbi:MAG: AMP-binding protein, partial [Ignavibacteria bacterium]